MLGLSCRPVRCLCLAAMTVLAPSAPPVQAVTPDEMHADPALEARARTISQQLRCVVCQNQSIDDSSAPLARDLRLLVRDRLQGGDSNEQALAFIVARYGNYVLLRPPLQINTLLLWLGPALMLLLASTYFGIYVRRTRQRQREAQAQLSRFSTAESVRLGEILTEGNSQ